MIKNCCLKCKKLGKNIEMEPKDNGKIHRRGFACRKSEPLLLVEKVPAPKVVIVTTATQHVMRHTGPINSMADAMMKAGLVGVRPNA